MKLGAFSISLSVQDLEISKVCYEDQGFTQFGEFKKSNYLIMNPEDENKTGPASFMITDPMGI
jgi:predicted lactoylglutathione lyase